MRAHAQNGWDLLDHGILKSGVSDICGFNESSRLMEWFWHVDSDWIIFGLTTNLVRIFDICWVYTVVPVKNVLLLLPTGKVLELGFPNVFNNTSLIKCGNIVSCLIQYSKKLWEMTCIVIEPHNFGLV